MDVTVFVQKWGRSQTAKDQEVMRKDLHTDPGTFGFGVVLEAKRLILILDRTLMYTDNAFAKPPTSKAIRKLAASHAGCALDGDATDVRQPTPVAGTTARVWPHVGMSADGMTNGQRSPNTGLFGEMTRLGSL